jgi:peptidoglycan/LPS O-acetylase OafA/YrhL
VSYVLSLLAVVVAAFVGLVIGLVVFHFIELPADRRRLDALTDRLVAELRVAAATRETLQAMRDAVRGTRQH